MKRLIAYEDERCEAINRHFQPATSENANGHELVMSFDIMVLIECFWKARSDSATMQSAAMGVDSARLPNLASTYEISRAN